MPIIATGKKEQFLLTLDYDVEVPFVEGDLDNIIQMLPKLYPEQQEDVLRIEKRFQVGKGYLCTNGTGTGKTFVGLGAAKRFAAQDKKNILIVTPTETKCTDWIKEAEHVELSITMLADTNDGGEGIVTCTYANFYQNDALRQREWDLIIYDESHYLNQNSKGDHTVYLQQHKYVANLPSAVKKKANDTIGPMPKYSSDPDWKWKYKAWEFQMNNEIYTSVDKTKVLFLSATPFAYHKSISYADGTLFDIAEVIDEVPDPNAGRYNAGGPWEKFMMEHFGYQMKNNKLTIPETGVDVSLMEREFFDKHVEKGIMSTRILELDRDYSRHFVLVNSDLGNFINSGIDMWKDLEIKKKYKYLSEVIDKKYNYGYVSQLLEAIKAKEILDRIQEHLDLGRKVVVFHGFNHTAMTHPFKFEPEKLVTADTKWMYRFLVKEIEQWEQEFPEYLNLDLDDLSNARKTIKERFPDVMEFNGTITSKKKKRKNLEDFNDNYSGKNLIMIQEKAGREGISCHDKIGNKQRVLINLSLPVAPTAAIQTEGRIYRSGVKSDAIYEYPVLHTNFEKNAFATKIAQRSKTAENLAMGHLARDLETSFKEGYINYITKPPYIGQGVGGKKADRTLQTVSDFEKAKTYYFSRAKKTAQTKSYEGTDYFATPEPLGFKMVEWLNPQPAERGLEPSVGHGSIGRWFPGNTENIFVEPSLKLFSEMNLLTEGRGVQDEFEHYYIGNKFEFIAMNPPFGKGGKTAIDHVAKAVGHLYPYKRDREYYGSRLLAIIPAGPSTDKRLEEFMDSKAFKNFRYTGEILLPDVTFKRAGTQVMTRIIKIECVTTGNEEFNRIDLRDCSDIGEFFDRIENLIF